MMKRVNVFAALVAMFFFTTILAGCSNAQDNKPAAVTEKPAATAEKPVVTEAKPARPAETLALATPTAGGDLVYLKAAKAVASSFDETPDWAPKPDAMATVDGDMDTRWASDYKDNQFIYLDFGKPKTISKIIVRWEQAYPTSYKIAVSDDSTTWKDIKTLEGQAGGASEIVFEPVACRYVKVEGITRVSPEWGISIWEIEPYGPKDKNPDDKPIGEVFAAVSAKAEAEKRLGAIMPKVGEIVASPGPIMPTEFQRGVNYTSWDANELGGETSDLSLMYLAQQNVGHVALMVVRYMDDAAKKTIYIDPAKTATDESLGHSINIIHALGMKVMLKPHVDLADEDMRSNILPSEEWFVNYKEYIVHMAQIAAKYNVELLCIGTELSNVATSTWREKWIDLIQAVRQVYKGALTYAANFDDYDVVSFWPEMDYIGIDAYFQLTDKNNPPLEELIAGWKTNADTLEQWLKDAKLDKPVIFTEIGYDTVEGSNKQPYRVLPTLTKYKESQEEQSNCLTALFEVMSKRAWFKGFYWWNYFPRPDLGPLGYTLRGKKGEKVLSEWFGKLK